MESIGRYEILRKLGEGGMGVVYAARDEALGRVVAIKTIREGAEPRARERLQREAKLAASINHPNVCHVFEVGEHDGALYIAMELLEGDSLAARIARGALPLGEAIAVTREILAALAAPTLAGGAAVGAVDRVVQRARAPARGATRERRGDGPRADRGRSAHRRLRGAARPLGEATDRAAVSLAVARSRDRLPRSRYRRD